MTNSQRYLPIVSAILVLAALACSARLPLDQLDPVLTAAAPTSTPALAAQADVTPADVTPPPALPTLTPAPAVPLITSSEEQQLIDLYDRVNPSVVSIVVQVGNEGFGQGSGFVFDDQGHVVTNQHVVEGATEIEVDFSSGLKLRGEVLGTDPDSDLAVIRVDNPPADLVALPLADSESVRVGQRVVAIGNPFGLAGTMTVGIISGLGRSLQGNRPAEGGGAFTAPDILQTDAAINPGNS